MERLQATSGHKRYRVASHSASLHDSQVAIPLIKLTSRKVTYLYDLMDAAYDAKRIEETNRECGHVPITDKNGRGQEVSPWHRMKHNAIKSGLVRNGQTSIKRRLWRQQCHG